VTNVGRLDFDNLQDLKQYVDKLIRIEIAAALAVTRDTILFSPDPGLPDPIYFSLQYLVQPLTEKIKDTFELPTHTVVGGAGTKANLFDALTNKRPAPIYTASHGLSIMEEPFEVNKS